MTKLSDISIISSGVFLKSSINGNVKYLQSKHFDSRGIFQNNAFAEVEVGKSQKHLLQDGNILFSAKGAQNFAATYKESMGLSVASSTFCVIKITSQSYTPDFVCWYLNHPTTQSWIKSKSMGTSVKHISITNLQEIEIPEVPLDTQHKIVEIAQLAERQEQIKLRLIELNRLQLNNMLINKIK